MHYNKDKVFLFLNVILFIVVFSVFIKSDIVRAQAGFNPWGENDITKTAIEDIGLRAQDPGVTIVNIIRVILGFLGIVAVVIIMYAGFLWMTAGGNAEQIEKAKKWMINGGIGLAIILSSFAIASFILSRLIAATGAGGGSGQGQGGGWSAAGYMASCVDPATEAESLCGIGNTECAAVLAATPYVCGLSPEKGRGGTYVTIKGYHFDDYVKDSSKVEFYDKTSNTATLAEIVICPGNSLVNWTDNRIIIRVPDVEIGDYTVRVLNKGGYINEADNRKIFKVTDGAAVPGIACILPGAGKENADVIVYGDYFGDTKETASEVVFEQEVIANIVDGADWSMKEIKTSVPSGAMRGDVAARVSGLQSNGYPFTVVCEKNGECASGCCYNSSYCANATYCQPGLGEDCLGGCGGQCQSKLACDSESCKCRELQPGDGCIVSSDAACSASGECTGDLVCNRENCVCENLPTSGAKCYGGCGVDGRCASGNICNADCVCERTEVSGNGVNENNGANENLAELPVIFGFSPPAGHSGDYVTIYGRDFGDKPGELFFGDAAGLPAQAGDFSFPDECLAGVWTNNQIIVKVPRADTGDNTPLTPLQEGNYVIKIRTNTAYGGYEAVSDENFYVGDYCSDDFKPCGFGSDKTDSCTAEGEGKCVTSVAPGLCKISPSNGHDGTEVNFFGENFSAAAGKAMFNAETTSGKIEKVDVEVSDWTEGKNRTDRTDKTDTTDRTNTTNGTAVTNLADLAKANAPSNVRNGLINIISASGFESNGINFEYMRCSADNECSGNPIMCCPTNSYFEGSCMANAAACGLGAKSPTDYMWSFTTEIPPAKNCAVITDAKECESNGYCCFDGSSCTTSCPESLVPKVEEHCDKGQSCNNNAAGPSPSPWKEWPNGESACVDSIIRADFSAGINQDTLKTGNIIIKECSSENLCDGAVVGGKVDSSVMGFSFTADNNLTKNTWYQVTLKGDEGIKAADDAASGKIGKFLDGDGDGAPGGDYVWKFKTRDDDKPCEAGCAFVNPAEYTASNKDLIKYTGSVRPKNNVCELLRNRGEAWSWSSADSAKATISSSATCCENGNCGNDKTCVLPIAETFGAPVKISGTVKVNASSLSDTADLYIDFTDFKVEEFWPQCNASCLNAAIGARFSGEIKTDISAGKTGLYQCAVLDSEGKRCATYATQSLAETASGLVSESILNSGQPSKGNISLPLLSGKYLASNKWYRAIIKGGADGVKNINGGGMDGLNYDSDGDNAKDAFSWEFKTGATECSVSSVYVEPSYGVVNQIGAGLMYSAVPVATADICNGQKLNAFSYDWNWSAPAGSFASVSNYPICGNGIVEKGEDCDRGQHTPIPSQEGNCSDICQNLGNTKKCGNCCGNGTHDANEECDGEVWCNDKCLRKGSNTSYGSICGNKIIETGEECDGEAGCDIESCLWRGTVKCANSTDLNCCGNNKGDAGEECDYGASGNTDDGIGCSSICLREGTAKCSGNCCGNGKVDAGEDCDLGNKNDAAGGLCSGICLNTGNSSACGNGIVEVGEDCDEGERNGKSANAGCGGSCLNLGTITGTAAASMPYQLATAESGPTAAGQTALTTDIIAKEVASAKSGTGKFTIQCGFQNDAQCPAGMGVGINGCCYARPSVISPVENITGLCPNGVLEATFNQIMDKDILEKAKILEKKNDGSGCGEVKGAFQENKKTPQEVETRLIASLQQMGQAKKQENNKNELKIFTKDMLSASGGGNLKLVISNLVKGINNFLFDLFLGNRLISALGNFKIAFASLVNSAKADADAWCPVGQKITVWLDNGKTRAIIAPSELLDSGAEYRLNFDGLKNIYGVPIADTANKITVSAQQEICLIDHIDVKIDNTSPTAATVNDIFICAGRNDCGSATVELIKDDDANSATAGNQHLYRAFALDKDENLLTANYFWEEDDPSNAIRIEDISSKQTGQNRYVTANPIEEADAAVSVGGASAYGAATTTVAVKIFMCEDPWPSIADFPYTDSDYNFSSFYCKDKKPANLPGIGNITPICNALQDKNCPSGILKEYLWVEE